MYVGYGLYFNKFLGEMHWGENKCINPTIDIISERYEIFDENGRSDVRVNVLGTVGMYQLGMLYWVNELNLLLSRVLYCFK